MDTVLTLPGVTKADLIRFNTVRIWMGVTHLSEISSADGTCIARDAWSGIRPRHTPCLWPYQPKPGPLSFRAWRRLLADSFLAGHRSRVEERTVNLILRYNLGHWLQGSVWLQGKWSSFYSPSRRLLLIVYNPALRRYNCHVPFCHTSQHNVFFHPRPSSSLAFLPRDRIPVDITHRPKSLHIGKTERVETPTPTPQLHTFDDYVNQLPAWDRYLIQDLFLRDLDQLLQALRLDASLFLCSDGGAADSKGSYGSVIASDDRILTELRGQAHGANPRSFRAEGYGLLANLRLIRHLMVFFDIQRTSSVLTLYCDNQGLLDRLAKSRESLYVKPRRFLLSESDLEMQILDTLSLLATTAHLKHVKGHQDDSLLPEELPWPAKLNVRCDTLATEELQHIEHPTPLVPFFPASLVSLTVQGSTLTHHIPSQLRHLYSKLAQRPYLEKHHQWSTGVFDTIHWDLLRSCLTVFSTVLRLFFVKWINSLLPFQAQQHKFKQSPTPACPSRCGASVEDASHFLRCSHLDRIAIFTALQTQLTDLFNTLHFDPYLRRIVWLFLDQYLDAPSLVTPEFPDPYRALYHAQRLIGPDSLIYGFFHTDWVQIQDDYLRFRNLPRNKNQSMSTMKRISSIIFSALHEL